MYAIIFALGEVMLP